MSSEFGIVGVLLEHLFKVRYHEERKPGAKAIVKPIRYRKLIDSFYLAPMSSWNQTQVLASSTEFVPEISV